MPLEWEMVAVQPGYLGMRLCEWREGPGLMLRPDWRRQRLVQRGDGAGGPMVAPCEPPDAPPHAVSFIVGEFPIAIAIGSLARSTRSGQWSRSLAAGVLAGLALLPCHAVAFWADEGRG